MGRYVRFLNQCILRLVEKQGRTGWQAKKYEETITKIFIASGNTYGPDRVCAVLRRQGYTASYKRVSKILKRLGLVSIHNKRRQRSLTDSRNAKAKNWVNLIQGLKSFESFQVITSDISYVRTPEGF